MTSKKKNSEITSFPVRVNDDFRPIYKQYKQICKEADTTVSREVRLFIKSEVKKKAQKEMF